VISLKFLIHNQAIRGTVIVSLGFFVASVFGYLLQFFLGRILSVSEYGAFNALLAVFTVLTVFSSSLMNSLIKVVSDLKAKDEFDVLTHFFIKLSLGILVFGFLVSLVVYLARSEISGFLKIEDDFLITVFGLYIGISFLGMIPSSYLQGLLKFGAFSFWTVMGGIFRFGIPAALVYFGYKTSGVFFGMVLATVLAYLLSLVLLKKDFGGYSTQSLQNQYRKLISFIGPMLFVNIGMTLLNNVDVILVKHYLSGDEAGIYSGVVTLGKVLLFGAGTVGVVMFPQISSAFAKKEDFSEKFKPFLMLQIFVVLCGVVIFAIFPKFITLMMFGERFLPAVQYLPKFAFFTGVYVMINFLILFFLAVEKTRIVLFQIPAIAGQFVLITLYHSSIDQIINVNVAVSVFLLLFVVLYYFGNAGFNNSACLQAGKNN